MATTTRAKTKSTTKKKSTGGGLLAKLKSKQGVLNKVRKEKAGDGFTDDSELLAALSITKEKQGKTARVQLRKAALHEVNDKVIFQLNFTIQEGPAKGLMAQLSVWIDLDDDEDLEKSFKSICFALQKMGYETEELEVSDLEDLANELTEEKPYLVIYISAYKYKRGAKKGQLGVNVRVNGSYDPDDSEEEEDVEDEEEVDDEEEDSDDSEDSEEDEESEEDEDDGDDEEDVEYEEEEDEEEEDESEIDENDPSTWIGSVAKVKPPKARKAFKAKITKYVKRGKKLHVTAMSSKKEYVISPDDVEELNV